MLNPYPNKPCFLCVDLKYMSFKDTGGKGEITCYEQFLIVPQCLLPVCRIFFHFHQI